MPSVLNSLQLEREAKPADAGVRLMDNRARDAEGEHLTVTKVLAGAKSIFPFLPGSV